MSIEAHPNIQAVEFSTDILQSMRKSLRGNGLEHKDKVVSDERLKEIVVNFVVDVSTRIDEVVNDEVC